MTGENGKAKLADDFRAHMLDQWVRVTQGLLLDLKAEFPCVRDLLLGNETARPLILPSVLRVERRPLEIVVSIQRSQFGCVARWTGNDLHGILETIENDLQTETGPWELDWREREKVQRKWSCV